jgi:RNA polymerase sigma factor (sigma-70 family)
MRRGTMISFVDSYMQPSPQEEYNPCDEQRIMSKALSGVLPIIIDRELTEKQRTCLKLFYVNGMSQVEIARELKLSQPTVSRHLAAARDITNKFLSYCSLSVKRANDQWLSLS